MKRQPILWSAYLFMFKLKIWTLQSAYLFYATNILNSRFIEAPMF
jgi:hypothetical protein